MVKTIKRRRNKNKSKKRGGFFQYMADLREGSRTNANRAQNAKAAKNRIAAIKPVNTFE
jgi:hypothetical protein